MNKTIKFSVIAILSLCFSLFLISCPSGLEPSWKNANKPVLSLDFSSSFFQGLSDSRALVQGDGFLYIKTIGGPSSPDNGFYGPFTIAQGATFSTTDIPAGTYEAIMVIYAATKPSPEATFNQLMNLPDAEIDAGMNAGQFSLEKFFDSDASIDVAESVSIVAGRVNTIKLTLEPLVWEGKNVVYLQPEPAPDPPLIFGDYSYNSGPFRKQFIELVNVGAGAFTCTDVLGGFTSVGVTALYDARGKLIKSWGPSTSDRTCTIPELDDYRAYFYIEYAGEGSLHFSVALTNMGAGPVDP